MKRHAFVMMIAAFVVPGCRPERPAIDALFDLPSAAALVSARFDPVRPSSVPPSIGTARGEPTFGLVGAVATHPDGRVAVIDRPTCEVVVLDGASGAELARIGRCGDGPGEMDRPTSIAWRQDSLLVLSAGSSRLQAFSISGEEGWRRTLRGEAARAREVLVLQDSVILLTVAAQPGPADAAAAPSAQAPSIVAVALDRDRTIWSAVPVPRLASAVAAQLESAPTACVFGRGRSRRLLVANAWATEWVVLEWPRRDPAAHARVAVDWTLPLRGDEPLPSRPGATSTAVACAEDAAFLWQVRYMDQAGGQKFERGHLLRIDTTGQLIGARKIGPADSLLHERPVAARGDTLLVRLNRGTLNPRVAQVVGVFDTRRVE